MSDHPVARANTKPIDDVERPVPPHRNCSCPNGFVMGSSHSILLAKIVMVLEESELFSEDRLSYWKDPYTMNGGGRFYMDVIAEAIYRGLIISKSDAQKHPLHYHVYPYTKEQFDEAYTIANGFTLPYTVKE